MKEIAIAIVSLVIGAIMGPHITWNIEKKKLLLAHRRELISRRRKMLYELSQRQVKTGEPVVHIVELFEDFHSLKPHLKPDVVEQLGLSENIKGQVFETLQKSEALIPDIIQPGKPLKNSSTFRLLADEIARIENDWKLV